MISLRNILLNVVMIGVKRNSKECEDNSDVGQVLSNPEDSSQNEVEENLTTAKVFENIKIKIGEADACDI